MALLLVSSNDTEISPDELDGHIRMLVGVEDVEIQEHNDPLLNEIGVGLMNLENIHDLNCPIRELRLKIERKLGMDFTATHLRTNYSGNMNTDIRLKVDLKEDREAIKGILRRIRGVEEVQG